MGQPDLGSTGLTSTEFWPGSASLGKRVAPTVVILEVSLKPRQDQPRWVGVGTRITKQTS